jgi:hypothetical protein
VNDFDFFIDACKIVDCSEFSQLLIQFWPSDAGNVHFLLTVAYRSSPIDTPHQKTYFIFNL